MIEEIGLSITDGCNANCVFCPRRDYPSGTPKFMSIEMVRKIVKEVSADKFKAKHNLSHIVVGENGEPTLHKGLIDILREVKKLDVQVDLFTNFSGMTTKKSKTIIEEELVDIIHTNIDGVTEKSYKQIKGLDYNKVMRNLNTFIEHNNEKIKVFVHAVLAERYVNAVNKAFGKKPVKLANPIIVPNEERLFMKMWEDVDVIHGVDDCLMWAEKKNTIKKPEQYVCQNYERIKVNAFINPRGDWYLCCFDVGNEIVLGNIQEQTFDEIYESETRKDILELIRGQKFDELPSPCNRVDCCQVIPR